MATTDTRLDEAAAALDELVDAIIADGSARVSGSEAQWMAAFNRITAAMHKARALAAQIRRERYEHSRR